MTNFSKVTMKRSQVSIFLVVAIYIKQGRGTSLDRFPPRIELDRSLSTKALAAPMYIIINTRSDKQHVGFSLRGPEAG